MLLLTCLDTKHFFPQEPCVLSLLEEKKDHHGWQRSDMAFGTWDAHISVWSTWAKNLNRVKKLDFFCTKYLVVPCFISQTHITGTWRLLHKDEYAAITLGGSRGSSSLHCIAESEPEAMIHHNALVQCWHRLLLSNKTPVVFSAGAAIAT